MMLLPPRTMFVAPRIVAFRDTLSVVSYFQLNTHFQCPFLLSAAPNILHTNITSLLKRNSLIKRAHAAGNAFVTNINCILDNDPNSSTHSSDVPPSATVRNLHHHDLASSEAGHALNSSTIAMADPGEVAMERLSRDFSDCELIRRHC